MAGFSLNANVVLKGPIGARGVVASIQQQLRGINANVNINLPKGVGSQISSLNTQLNTLNSSLNNINQSGSATNGLKSAAQSMSNVAKQAQIAKTVAFSLGESIGEAARKFTSFSIAAGVMIGFASAVKDGITSAVKFQHEMVRLQQVANGSKEGIAGIRDEITRLSTSLGVSSNDLSKVAVTLRQAGLSAKDTQEAMSAIASASVAPTFNDISNSVEGAIAVMQQFNVKAEDLTKTFGSINRVSADFAVEADDIVHAIRRSGGAFKAAGGDLNELIALFTSVRQTTRESAETIASGFNTIFARLQRPQAVEQLRLMGIELRHTADEAKAFGKTEGEFVGPYEAIKRLNIALASVPTSSPEYAAIVEEIGGFRQVSKVIPLIQQLAIQEKALGSATYGQTSLARSNILAQQSLTVQVSKLKEEFLDLFRVITSNKTLQEFGGHFLSIASFAIKAAKAIEPLIPLITAFATLKIATTIGSIGTSGFASGLKAGLTKTKPFATGGVVPGVGDGDTVPARLTPGEFVLRKSAAKSIGYDSLHKMNRGGSVAKEQYVTGGEVVQRFAKGKEVKPGSIQITGKGTEESPFKTIAGDYYAREQDNVKISGGRDFNRARINPPAGKVGMFVTNTNRSKKLEHPIVPIQNLKPSSQVAFEKDKKKLVDSNKLTQKQADQITNVTVPIAIRSPGGKRVNEVYEIINRNIVNSLNNIAGEFSSETAGIDLHPSDAQRIMKESVRKQGVGHIFEAFLKVVGAKTGGSREASSATANFDLDPVTSTGLSGLFGDDVNGITADVKLNDNPAARASVVSKAVRKYGISTNVSFQKLDKLQKVSDNTSRKKDPKTGKYIKKPDIYVPPLEAARRQLGSSKHAKGGIVQRFATGGVVQPLHFADGDKVPFLDPKQEQFFSLHPTLATLFNGVKKVGASLRGDRASELLANPDVLTDDIVGKVFKASRVKTNIKNAKTALDKHYTTPATDRVLKIPFAGDTKGLALIGRGTVGIAGNRAVDRKAGNVASEAHNEALGDDLKSLGIERIHMAYTNHIVSNQLTKDFDNTLFTPVSSAIKGAFLSRFGDVAKTVNLEKSELRSIEGTLFEKYVSSLTKNVLGGNKNGKNALFDFPDGISTSNSINKVFLPKLKPGDRTDAKIDLSQPRVVNSLAGKYLVQNIDKIAKMTGKTIKPKEPAQDFLKKSDQAVKASERAKKLQITADKSPKKQQAYLEALDKAIDKKKELYKLEVKRGYNLDDLPPGYKEYATGGKVKAPPRHFAVGGQATGSDTVPALLTPGEFVVSKESAQRIGYNKLHAMNKFATGGAVFPENMRRYSSTPVSPANTYPTYPVNMGGYPYPHSTTLANFPSKMQPENIKNTNNDIPSLLREIVKSVNDSGTKIVTKIGKGTGTNKSAAALPASESSTNNIPDKVSKFGRLKPFLGTAAVVAAQYAPSLIEHTYGTVDNPKGNVQNARYGAAAGGAISTAATGAALGGSVAGPYGAAIAGATGAIYGFITSLDEADKRIKAISFDKDLKKFNGALSRALVDVSKIDPGNIGQIRTGLSAIDKGAAEAPNKDLFFAEHVDPGQIQELLAGLSRGADLKSTDSEDVQRNKILGAQGGVGRDLVNTLRQLPEFKEQNTNQILKSFQKIGVTDTQDKARKASLVDLEKANRNQVQSFSRLSSAIDRATLHLEEMNTALDTISSVSEGSFRPTPISTFSKNAAAFGTSAASPEDFNKTVDFISSAAGGTNTELMRDFSSSTKDIHNVLSNLPQILGEVAKHGVNSETLSSNVTDAVKHFAGNTSDAVRSKINTTAASYDPGEFLKQFKADPHKFIEDFKKAAFPGIEDAIQNAAKKLEDNANNYAANLSKLAELQNRAIEAQDKYVDAQFAAVGAERTFAAHQAGITINPFSTAEHDQKFNIKQAQLTGFRSEAALDPNAIANKLKTVRGQITEAQASVNSKPTQAAQQNLQNLGTAAGRLQTALQRLASPVERNAALQERLAQLNSEEDQRLSLAERYFVADPGERFKMDQTANIAHGVATGNVDANLLPPEFKQALIGLTHDLEEIPTDILGGLKGKDFRHQFLASNPDTASIANLPQGRAAEQNNLEGQIVANFRVAAEAQAELTKSLQSSEREFFTKLESNQAKFLVEFQRGLIRADIDKENVGEAAAKNRFGTANTKQVDAEVLSVKGIENYDTARKLVGHEAFAKLSTNIKDQKEIEDNIEKSKTTRLISQEDLNKHGDGSYFTRVRDSFFKDKDRSLANKVGEHGFSESETSKIIEDFKSRVQQSPVANAGNAEAFDDLFHQALTKGLEDKRKNTAKEARANIETLHGVTGLKADKIQNYAADSEEITKLVNSLQGFSNLKAVRDETTAAQSSLEGLTKKISGLNKVLEDFNKQNPVPATTSKPEIPPGTPISSSGFFRPKGTDTVPAMLSPGEAVVNAQSTADNADLLKRINGANGPLYAEDGYIPKPEDISNVFSGGDDEPKDVASIREKLIQAKALHVNLGSDTDPLVKSNIGLSLESMYVKLQGANPDDRVIGSPRETYNQLTNADKNASADTQLVSPTRGKAIQAVTGIAGGALGIVGVPLISMATSGLGTKYALNKFYANDPVDRSLANSARQELNVDRTDISGLDISQANRAEKQSTESDRQRTENQQQNAAYLQRRKKAEDDLQKKNSEDLAGVSNSVVKPTSIDFAPSRDISGIQPITLSDVQTGKYKKPETISASIPFPANTQAGPSTVAPDDRFADLPEKLKNNSKISDDIKQKILTEQIRKKAQVDAQVSKQDEAIGYEKDKSLYQSLEQDQIISQYTRKSKTRQDAQVAKGNGQTIGILGKINNQDVYNPYSAFYDEDADYKQSFSKLSRRQKGNFAHVDSIINTYTNVKSSDLAANDLAKGASVQEYFAREFKRKDISDEESKLLESKQAEFAEKTGHLRSAILKESQLRATYNQPQIIPEGLVSTGNGNFSLFNPRNKKHRNLAQDQAPQRNEALKYQMLTNLSNEQLEKEKKREVTSPVAIAKNKRRKRGQRALPVNDTENKQVHQSFNLNEYDKYASEVLERKNKFDARFGHGGFASGGLIPQLPGHTKGVDDRLAAVSGNEYVVSEPHAKNNLATLEAMNKGKIVHLARGGSTDGSVSVTSQQSSGSSNVPSLMLDQSSIGVMTGFTASFAESVNKLTEPLQGFGQTVAGLQQIIGPLNAFSQNVQGLVAPFTQFNTASTNLAAGMALFNKNADTLATAMSSLANLPSTITVQGTTQVNVVVTGAEAFNAIKGQMQDEIMKQVSAKLKPEIIADLKSGAVV